MIESIRSKKILFFLPIFFLHILLRPNDRRIINSSSSRRIIFSLCVYSKIFPTSLSLLESLRALHYLRFTEIHQTDFPHDFISSQFIILRTYSSQLYTRSIRALWSHQKAMASRSMSGESGLGESRIWNNAQLPLRRSESSLAGCESWEIRADRFPMFERDRPESRDAISIRSRSSMFAVGNERFARNLRQVGNVSWTRDLHYLRSGCSIRQRGGDGRG